jgi:transposase
MIVTTDELSFVHHTFNRQSPAAKPGSFFPENHIMADYFEHTVIQQVIPDADMTSLERLLLSRIFDSERDGDGWYFFAEQSPTEIVVVPRPDLARALASSPDMDSTAYRYVTEQLADIRPDVNEIELDFTGTPWETFFQDIVKRSGTLPYISIAVAFTCSKMRPDGFGGVAVLVTRDVICGKSTSDLLEDLISDAGLDAMPNK